MYSRKHICQFVEKVNVLHTMLSIARNGAKIYCVKKILEFSQK
jgi:hypothetical protein